MLSDLLFGAGFSLYTGGSLLLANLAHRRWRNFVWSRKLAHGLIGVAIMLAPWVFQSMLVPALLAAGMTVTFLLTHRQEIWHGVAQRGRYSEVAFAFSVFCCFLSGLWVDPWLGTAAALSVAWSDGVTGIFRWWHLRRHAKGNIGSVACFISSSLICGLLVSPLWLAITAATVGTLAERLSGDVALIKFVDDNISMPLSMLAIFLVGGWLF